MIHHLFILLNSFLILFSFKFSFQTILVCVIPFIFIHKCCVDKLANHASEFEENSTTQAIRPGMK